VRSVLATPVDWQQLDHQVHAAHLRLARVRLTISRFDERSFLN
jgi:hypothetical protein